jgi:hypothetical protein
VGGLGHVPQVIVMDAVAKQPLTGIVRPHDRHI